MDLVTPAIGLIFWTVVIFTLLLVLLRAFAWKPILNAVKERNESIAEALNAAEKAKKDIEHLHARNEEVLREARLQHDTIVKEAREIKDKMISEAKLHAKTEADKIIENARKAIENEKRVAINDIKNQMSILSIEIAQKLIQKELSSTEGQQNLINDLLDKTKIN